MLLTTTVSNLQMVLTTGERVLMFGFFPLGGEKKKSKSSVSFQIEMCLLALYL